MATKARDVHTPRFDFGCNPDPDGKQMGTIKDLLAEINQQHPSANGTEADIKSLGVTLKFFSHFTGEEYKRITVKLPLSTLKTIKLLYVTNNAKDVQMFRLIAPPHASEPATMESATGASIARDKYGAAIVEILSNQLALEIGGDKLKPFYDLLKNSGKQSVAEELNAHIERTNDEIYRLLTSRLGNDNIRLADACYRLAKEIDCVNYTKAEDADPAPLNEAIFAHLQGLGFVHFALHHRDFIKTIRISQTIHPIDTAVNALCQTLSDAKGATVLPDERLFSVNNFHHLVAGYHRELISLVRAATKFNTRKKTLFENTVRAKRILALHVYRCYDETDLDAQLLSVFDIVAALCSVRYQQGVKTEYKPKWLGQVSKGKDPQAHFDKTIDLDDPFQYQGVIQIYLYRFQEYLSAFTGMTESSHAWMSFQVSRFDAYARMLQLNDINAIIASVYHFDEYCIHHARVVSGKSLNTAQ
jgi:hypothetical protein